MCRLVELCVNEILSPLNWILIVSIVYLWSLLNANLAYDSYYSRHSKKSENENKDKSKMCLEEEAKAPRNFTVKLLKQFNGVENPEIYVAVRSNVYDVTDSKFNFYAPGGPYHCFAGKDASRALSKDDLEIECPTTEIDNLADLTVAEEDRLEEWEQVFSKYPIIGRLMSQQEFDRSICTIDSSNGIDKLDYDNDDDDDLTETMSPEQIQLFAQLNKQRNEYRTGNYVHKHEDEYGEEEDDDDDVQTQEENTNVDAIDDDSDGSSDATEATDGESDGSDDEDDSDEENTESEIESESESESDSDSSELERTMTEQEMMERLLKQRGEYPAKYSSNAAVAYASLDDDEQEHCEPVDYSNNEAIINDAIGNGAINDNDGNNDNADDDDASEPETDSTEIESQTESETEESNVVAMEQSLPSPQQQSEQMQSRPQPRPDHQLSQSFCNSRTQELKSDKPGRLTPIGLYDENAIGKTETGENEKWELISEPSACNTPVLLHKDREHLHSISNTPVLVHKPRDM